MMRIYRQLYEILSRRDRRIVFLLFGVMLAAAFMETIGVASILPFIAVLANPEIVQKNEWLKILYEGLGFDDTRVFLVFMGVAFFMLFVLGLLARATAFWAQARFANTRMHLMSSRLFAGYLSEDYEWFLGRHSSQLGSSVLSEINRVIHEALFPSLQVIAHCMVILLLMVLLVAVDPALAAAVVAVLGGGYLAIYLSTRGWVARIGKTAFQSNRARFRITQEALGGIKVVKVKGLEHHFRGRFEHESAKYARSRVSEQLIGQVPSYAMQGVIFGGMLLVILYLMAIHEDISKALPILAMYAVAGYRLMPSLQNTYRHLITIRNAEPVLSAIHSDLVAIGAKPVLFPGAPADFRLELTSSINLRNVEYRYPGGDRAALKSLSLVIERSSIVAFVGPTGCGKTTTVDVILGLLKPTSGALEVDGEKISVHNVRGWQRNIGYVPQDIFLADASIAANIAYGIPEKDVNMDAVQRAARIARLHDFVVGELREGYSTFVGERGVRLSGGQRQRIGIARALYHDPEVLVLDEATSALDNVTEHAVMEAVKSLARKKTIVMIAHRLSTVRECDEIFFLEDGCLIDSGTFDELLSRNRKFRAMSGEDIVAVK